MPESSRTSSWKDCGTCTRTASHIVTSNPRSTSNQQYISTEPIMLTHKQNILVASPGPYWSVQITDFGIVRKTQTSQTSHSMGQGTMGFMAPEMLVSALKGSP